MIQYLEVLITLFCIDSETENKIFNCFDFLSLVERGEIFDGRSFLRFSIPYDEQNVFDIQNKVETLRKELNIFSDGLDGESIEIQHSYELQEK